MALTGPGTLMPGWSNRDPLAPYMDAVVYRGAVELAPLRRWAFGPRTAATAVVRAVYPWDHSRTASGCRGGTEQIGLRAPFGAGRGSGDACGVAWQCSNRVDGGDTRGMLATRNDKGLSPPPDYCDSMNVDLWCGFVEGLR
jgi:hypothetical protein